MFVEKSSPREVVVSSRVSAAFLIAAIPARIFFRVLVLEYAFHRFDSDSNGCAARKCERLDRLGPVPSSQKCSIHGGHGNLGWFHWQQNPARTKRKRIGQNVLFVEPEVQCEIRKPTRSF